MAKARDWAVKFGKVTSVEECEKVLDEYAEETKCLIDLRTKNSKDDYKKAARDGAIREQKQKFMAAIRYLPSFIVEMYDGMVARHINPSPAKTKQEEVVVKEELPRSELISV